MPKNHTDYSKTIIYKLVKNDDYDNVNIYIGNTTNFIKRKNYHKSSCYNVMMHDYYNKKSQYIRDNGGWEEWYMIEIEKYPCNDGNEARAREEYWRCYFNANLNSQKALRTKDEQILYQKEYDKQRWKNMDILDKQKHNERTNNHYHNNKEKISNKAREKITCECGCVLSKDTLTRHRKSKKHIDLIKNIYYIVEDDVRSIIKGN
jgi:hypothetical protein